MITQRTFTTTNNVLREAAQILNTYEETSVARWACEVCGMLYTGSSPDSCESCGASHGFTELHDERTEIGSRW